MISFLPRYSSCVVTVLFFVLFAFEPVYSQQASSQSAEANANQTISTEQALPRLSYIQSVLSQKIVQRSELGEQIEQANEQDKTDLRDEANELTTQIEQLRRTFENLAINGVDTSLFVSEPVEQQGDWREDVSLIAQPVIDSLKDLTDKPRKLKALNDEIALRSHELNVAQQALSNLQPELQVAAQGELGESLLQLERVWKGRADDARSAIEIAQFQVADVQGDQPITATLFSALINFVKGRGLTLFIAALAAGIVWFGVRFLLRGYRVTTSINDSPESRTRYRLAAYSVHALTYLLILIAVFVVFYERGDVLLLGLLILLIVGLALGIRHLLPQYLAEARLLLNIGAMREAERIVYQGLPWRVESINMYTILRNPDLHGVLRIPLAKLHGISSRPVGNDSWFPSKKGDSILLHDDKLMEVIEQNPDTIELRTRGGQQVSVPTQEFYGMQMINLSRGVSFGVTSVFGVDYNYQNLSHDTVPKVLRDQIREALEASDLEPFIKDIRVELKQAGASSIDYWLHVTMDSKAAKSYLRIQRMMQSACIKACTAQSWPIPYPHLSVVSKEN